MRLIDPEGAWGFSKNSKKLACYEPLFMFSMAVATTVFTEMDLIRLSKGSYFNASFYFLFLYCAIYAAMISGWLMDSYFGEYVFIYVGFGIALLAPLGCVLISILNFVKDFSVITQIVLGLLDVGLFFSQLIEPARQIFLLQQINLPEEQIKVRPYVFILFTVREGCKGLVEMSFSLLKSSKIFYLVVSFLSLVTFCLYVLLIFLSKTLIKRKPEPPKVINQTFGCIIFASFMSCTDCKGKEQKENWSEYGSSRYDSSITKNAKKFGDISKILFSLIFYSLGFCIIKRALEYQKRFKAYRLFTNVHFLSFLSCIALELIILPILSRFRILRTNLQCVGASFALIGFGSILSVCAQGSIEMDAGFLPVIGNGLIRIMNSLDTSAVVNFHTDRVVINKKESYVFDLTRNKEEEFNISSGKKSGTKYKIHPVFFQCQTYVLWKNGLRKVKYKDPLLSGPPGTNHPEHGRVIFIGETDTTSMLLSAIDGKNVTKLAFMDPDTLISLPPETYDIFLNALYLTTVIVDAGKTYSLSINYIPWVYIRETGPGLVGLIKPVQYNLTTIISIFLGFAISLSYVSLIAFIYLESQENMRIFSLSCLFMALCFGEFMYITRYLPLNSQIIAIFVPITFVGYLIFLSTSHAYKYEHSNILGFYVVEK